MSHMARIPVPSKLSGITNKIVSLSKRKYPVAPIVTPLFTFFMPRDLHSSELSHSGGSNHSNWCSYEIVPTESPVASPILAQKPLHASLSSPSTGYSFLAFRLATFGRVNSCSLEIEMRSSTGEVLVHHHLSTESLTDNQFISCPLTSRQLRKGEELIVTLSSPDATEDNCVAVWGLPSEHKISAPAFSTSSQEIAIGRVLTLTPLSARMTPHISVVRGCSEFALHTALGKAAAVNIPRQILPQQPFTVVFSLEEASYSDISLLVATYGRTNTCTLRWEIFDLARHINTPLAQGEISAALLQDNEWWRIPSSGIKGTQIAIVITSRDATPTNCVAVWVSSSTPTGIEKESCLPIELGVDNLLIKNYEAFVPYFSTKTESGIFYSGLIPNRGASSSEDYIITKDRSYTGYFYTTEPRLKIFTIECSSIDLKKVAQARLVLLSDKEEILGDMTFAIPGNKHRKSFHLYIPDSIKNNSGHYTYIIRAMNDVPFALCGECYRDQDASNLTHEWRGGVPVIFASAQSVAGLPEEMGAIPLHIPRYSLTVASRENPTNLIETGFRGETLAALPIPLGTVLWSFIAPKGRLTSIEFAIATFDRPNYCSVTVDIYRGRHIDASALPKSCRVFSRSFDARTFVDNQGFSFSIDEEISSRDEWFTAVVSSPDHTSRDKVALWCRAFSSHDGIHANLLQQHDERSSNERRRRGNPSSLRMKNHDRGLS